MSVLEAVASRQVHTRPCDGPFLCHLRPAGGSRPSCHKAFCLLPFLLSFFSLRDLCSLSPERSLWGSRHVQNKSRRMLRACAQTSRCQPPSHPLLPSLLRIVSAGTSQFHTNPSPSGGPRRRPPAGPGLCALAGPVLTAV